MTNIIFSVSSSEYSLRNKIDIYDFSLMFPLDLKKKKPKTSPLPPLIIFFLFVCFVIVIFLLPFTHFFSLPLLYLLFFFPLKIPYNYASFLLNDIVLKFYFSFCSSFFLFWFVIFKISLLFHLFFQSFLFSPIFHSSPFFLIEFSFT